VPNKSIQLKKERNKQTGRQLNQQTLLWNILANITITSSSLVVRQHTGQPDETTESQETEYCYSQWSSFLRRYDWTIQNGI